MARKTVEVPPIQPALIAAGGANPTPLPELIKVERNLNSLGFFIPAKKGRPSKEERSRVRVIRFPAREINGQVVRQSATIIPSPEHGLPTTADRDKYMALMKIVTDIKARTGEIQNPIAFTTYDLLRHLGHNTGGKNYEEVTQFLERMTATTIKSENAIFSNKTKRYQRDIFHVFDRAVVVGQEMPDGTVAQCNYVYLSQWQLENINTNYVLRMDFNAYVTLNRDIAKALFGHLHVWFYASRCRQVERLYSELCQLLDIQKWKHLSKIRQILAPSLEELINIGYLESWDVVKAADGESFKLVIKPGERLISILRPRVGLTQGDDIGSPKMRLAVTHLVERGINEPDARRLMLDVRDEDAVLDQIEWFDDLKHRMGNAMQNPPGFLFTMVKENWPIPADFESSRKRQLMAARLHPEKNDPMAVLEIDRQIAALQQQEEYRKYREAEATKRISKMYPGDMLTRKLRVIKRELQAKHPDLYGKTPSGWHPALEHHALRELQEEVLNDGEVDTLEDFNAIAQRELF